MVIKSAERDGGGDWTGGGVHWQMPGLKDGPELGARLIELAERAARAHEAQAAAGDDMSELGAAGARIAPRSAGIRWSGGGLSGAPGARA